MKRKSLILSSVILILAVLGGGFLLYQLLDQEPELYVAVAVPPGEERQHESRDFERKAIDLYNDIQFENEWQEEFTEQQVNSWLAEDFIESNVAKLLPPDMREPRVAFRPGRVFVAFRYGNESWNTVVSIQAKVWVAKGEPNVVAVEIEEVRAGALPLALKMMQDQITEGARQQNIDVQWYRNEGNPVAVLRLQADRREPSIQLQSLEIREGSIYFKGRSLDAGFRGFSETPFSAKAGG